MISFNKNIKSAVIILGIYLLPVFAFIKPYKDDYARIVDNYYEWDRDGRPLANVIMKFLNFNTHIGEMAIFNRIFAFILLSITCAYIGTYLIRRTPFINALAVSLIFTSPFFLQNLSYGFDVLTMSMSFALCIFIMLPAVNKNVMVTSLSVIVTTFAVLNIYQATYPFIISLIFLELISGGKDVNSSKIALIKILSAVISLALYKLFISNIIDSFYAKNHSTMIDPFGGYLISNLSSNFKGLFEMIGMVVNHSWMISFMPLMVVFCVALYHFFSSGHKKVFLITSVISFAAVVFSFLMFFLLKSPVYSPRVFIGFSCIIACVAIFSTRNSMVNDKVLFVSLALPYLLYLLTMSAFVSSQRSQYKFDLMLTEQIYNSLPSTHGKKEAVFVGGSPKTRTFWVAIKKYPIINHLFSPDLGWWNTKQFVEYEFPLLKLTNSTINPKDKFVCDSVVSEFNGFFTIVKQENTNYVFMKDMNCN